MNYREAEEVLAWLGPETEDPAQAPRMLKLFMNISNDRHGQSHTFAGGSQWPRVASSIHWSPRGFFPEYPYCNRVRIFEEICLASFVELVCGSHIISWEALCGPLEQFEHLLKDWRNFKDVNMRHPSPQSLRLLR